MKKLYALLFAAIIFINGNSFSQVVFTHSPVDTIEYGAPSAVAGTELVCFSNLYNNTATSISMRVTREQNVMNDAPGWTSAFCMDVCYLPTTDSVNYTFGPMDTVHFSFHFYIDNTPDSACAIMKWKNTATGSSIFQRFHGITQLGFGVNDMAASSASVNIYPMPITAGNDFTLSVSNIKSSSKQLSLAVYDIFGKLVHTGSAIEGITFMNLDLPAGIYSYSLISADAKLNSGKLLISH